jgi:hypothetical protein
MPPVDAEALAAKVVQQLQSDPELYQTFAQLDPRLQSQLIERLIQEELAGSGVSPLERGAPIGPQVEFGFAAPTPATSVPSARTEAERMLGVHPESQQQPGLSLEQVLDNIIGSFTAEEMGQLSGQAIVDAIRKKLITSSLPGWQARAIALALNVLPVAMRAMVAAGRGKDVGAEIGRGAVEQAFSAGMAGLMTRSKQPKADTERLRDIIHKWFPEATTGASAQTLKRSPGLVRETLGPLYYGSQALNEAMNAERQRAFQLLKQKLGLAEGAPLMVDVSDVFRKFGDKIEANFSHLMPNKVVIDAEEGKIVKLPIEEADELLSAIIHYTQGAGRLAEARSPTQVHLTQSVARNVRDSLSNVIEAALSAEPAALEAWAGARAKQFAWHTLRRLTGVESKPELALTEAGYWNPAITQANIRMSPALAKQLEGTSRYDPKFTQELIRAIYRGAPAFSQDALERAYIHTWMHPKIGKAPVTGLSFNPTETGRIFRRIRGTPDFRRQLPWGIGFAALVGSVTPSETGESQAPAGFGMEVQPGVTMPVIMPSPSSSTSAPESLGPIPVPVPSIPQKPTPLPPFPGGTAPAVSLSPEEMQALANLLQSVR